MTKTAPANRTSGLTGTVTLQWMTALEGVGYWVCWDTTNNDTCDALWWPNGPAPLRTLVGLTAGTYFWQVRAQSASGLTDADGGAWGTFTVGGSTPPGSFAKTAPAAGAAVGQSGLTLSWQPSSGATSYEYCFDGTADNACDGSWHDAGANTTVAVTLAAGTYSWQVRARNGAGVTEATPGWTGFTVSEGPAAVVTKLAPADAAAVAVTSVTLSWSSPVPDLGYAVCWDSTPNNACDTMWWPNGAATARVLTGLAPGTYYWQVRGVTESGTVEADSGAWWSFTVPATPPPGAAITTQHPARGAANGR